MNRPYFLFLLPLFFVLHGCMENYNFVPFKNALLLVLLYAGFSALFLLLFWLLYRNIRKAAVVAFFIMAYHFFFGSVHDMLRKIATNSVFTSYSFLIGGGLIAFILLVIFLKRTKRPLTRFSYYLNAVLLVVIAIDVVMLVSKMTGRKENIATVPEGMTACADCPKPDIYFIIADEYVGNSSLKEQFNFDNSVFTEELAKRGFKTLASTRSNYNYTPYSIASTLDMRYIELHSNIKANQPNLAACYQAIRNNKLLAFLQYHGYNFYNYSIFDFKGQPAIRETSFLPVKTKLITGQTFLSRINRDLRFNLITRFKSKAELKRFVYSTLANNRNIYDLTVRSVNLSAGKPKFVFTHLHIPHYPYYFDRNGKEQPYESLLEEQQVNKEHFVEYLQYGNKQYLALIDTILQQSKQPPVIILMGDHGFRHFIGEVDPKYYYLNHVSVLLPGKNYIGYSDSLTNVNFFRVFLNTSFRQQLPLLKDSTIFIKE